MMSVMQDLYDSEINFSVSTFWDGGFDVGLGDEMNSFVAKAAIDDWTGVEDWLKEKAIKHFPKSVFAAKYNKSAVAYILPEGKYKAIVADITGRLVGDNFPQPACVVEWSIIGKPVSVFQTRWGDFIEREAVYDPPLPKRKTTYEIEIKHRRAYQDNKIIFMTVPIKSVKELKE